MIIPTMPILTNPQDQEEVRKVILDLVRQMNAEIARLEALIP
jgi:hypothetical protein